MKKLITLFFISILSLQVYCSAQEILKVDYPAIKEYVTNHNTEFQKLMQRFEENDTLLTRQDHAMLYYGYSFTPAYKGSMDDFQDFRKLIKEEKYEDAYDSVAEAMDARCYGAGPRTSLNAQAMRAGAWVLLAVALIACVLCVLFL